MTSSCIPVHLENARVLHTRRPRRGIARVQSVGHDLGQRTVRVTLVVPCVDEIDLVSLEHSNLSHYQILNKPVMNCRQLLPTQHFARHTYANFGY